MTIIDVCGWTAYRDHIPDVKVTTTGFHPEIRGRFGITIKPDIPFDEVVASDYVAFVLPGGFSSHGYDEVYDPRIYISCVPFMASTERLPPCASASWLWLSVACLMANERPLTHSRHDNIAQLRDHGAVMIDEPVVVDDRIISCQGPAQTIEVAMRLLDDIIGPEASAEVRHYMMAENI